jgi:hypothetical protein
MKPTVELMSRDEFRRKVFERDKNSCILCGKPAVDAHHIIERKLWEDGGYYLDNGVSLCEQHHLEAEMTVVDCDRLRTAAGIENTHLPPQLYQDYTYDKWGNIVLPNSLRLRGDLFYDESVQKILKAGCVLNQFIDRVKYPRTFHLPWSDGVGDNDRVLEDISHFEGKEVVVTVKMDGENTSMYRDYIHARSLDYHRHPTRDYIKGMWATICHDIPEGWRICGENLYAKHSIHYYGLSSYFLVFSIWDKFNVCISYDDTLIYAQALGLETVPLLYRGLWDEKLIKGLYKERFEGNECEGYVVRLAEPFPYAAFKKSCAKYVRKNHITTHGHWMRERIEVNRLKDK